MIVNNNDWQEFNAKLSDFGLATMGPEGSNTHVTTRVMGTYGYAAPEYVSTGTYLSYATVTFPNYDELLVSKDFRFSVPVSCVHHMCYFFSFCQVLPTTCTIPQ